MGITIKQIAADLKLAVSTVSKALGGSYEISETTKARVLDYAVKMDYKPNPYASNLKRGRSGNIAVVLPEVSDSFFSSAIDGIEKVAREKGYHVLVYLTHEDVAREASIIRDFRNGRVDGVLISASAGNGKRDHLFERSPADIPIVCFDRVYAEMQTSSVVTDDFESGYHAARHLIEKGCKKPVFLSVEGAVEIIDHRQKGFEKALRENQIQITEDSTIILVNDESRNLKTLDKIFRSDARPDGVVASVEKAAMQVYTICHRLKVAIPHDVMVIAFSHLAIASLLNPSLTTITQPAFDMGKTAATLLFNLLEQKKAGKKEIVVLRSELIERDSTRL